MNPQQRWVALVRAADGLVDELDVISWQPEEGTLVGYALQPGGRHVVRADLLPGFQGYQRKPVLVTALPGTGWTVTYRVADREEQRRVLAWLVYDDGSVVCHDADEDGLVYPSCAAANFDRVQPAVS